MKTQWLVGGSVLAGAILAFFVIQRPDTGGAVEAPTSRYTEPTADQAPAAAPEVLPEPEQAPIQVEQGEDEVEPELAPMVRPGLPPAPNTEEGDVIPGPNPLAAEAQEKRSRPEAVQSGKASIPWTLIRRNLSRFEDERATELSNTANQLVLDLRRMRRDPDSFDYTELETRQRDLQTAIRSNGYDSDEEIKTMLNRVDDYLTEYHQLKAAE